MISRIIIRVVLSVFFICCCDGAEIDYSKCQDIAAVLEAESKAIAMTYDLETLADLYISRGETFFINEQYEKAFQDFQKAYDIVIAMSSREKEKVFLEFRVVLNLAFIYGVTGDESSVISARKRLVDLLDSICSSRRSKNTEITSQAWNQPVFVLCAAPKIHGPDQEPHPGWCKEVVISTGVMMAQIASRAPHASAKIILLSTVAILENKAISCCEAGGLWKACVGPIVEKWQVWNHKWKVLGVPPDPAWD